MSDLATPWWVGLGHSVGIVLVRLAGLIPLPLSYCGNSSMTQVSCHLFGLKVGGILCKFGEHRLNKQAMGKHPAWQERPLDLPGCAISSEQTREPGMFRPHASTAARHLGGQGASCATSNTEPPSHATDATRCADFSLQQPDADNKAGPPQDRPTAVSRNLIVPNGGRFQAFTAFPRGTPKPVLVRRDWQGAASQKVCNMW